MREGKCLLGMGNPAAETVVCLHMERSRLCQRSKKQNALFSKLCPLRDGLQYSRMMMRLRTGFLLRPFVFRCLLGLLSVRSTRKRRIRRSLAFILMTKDRYVRRVGVMDFCGMSV